MKKFEIISVVAFIFLFTIPIVSYAETGQKCASNCIETCSDGGTNKALDREVILKLTLAINNQI